VLVGDGPLGAALREQAVKFGIAERVTFTGHRDDVPDLVAAMDVFMMTSWHEGMPMALLEAMALGRPVVATRVGGIPEVIEDGSSGLLAAAGDRDALVELCVRLGESSELRRMIGDAGRSRVAAEFSSDTLRERLSAIYEDVLSAP
jgi:glycosyltransferase involved in cell wall biosynthesis